MPRLPIDYSKTVIYKLVHEDDYDNSNVYVGHTTDFIKRKYGHKKSCNNPNNKGYNIKVYKNIRQNGGWDAWKMIEIEKYPCKDEREASAREEHLRCEFNANLNAKKCFTTPEEKLELAKQYNKEYYKDNAEYYKQYRQKNAEKYKEYCQDNADKISEQRKLYYQENADKRKQYRQNNSDKISEQGKLYYQENADKISERGKEKVKCEYCSCEITRGSLTRHQKTAKCLTHQNK
jgi:hypothetical protein